MAIAGHAYPRACGFQQLGGDLLVDLVVFDQKDVDPAIAQAVVTLPATALRRQGLEFAGCHAADHAVPQMRLRDRLDEEAARAQCLCLIAHVIDAEGRHHDDLRLLLAQRFGTDAAYGFQAVHLRHTPVHEDEPVRVFRLGLPE